MYGACILFNQHRWGNAIVFLSNRCVVLFIVVAVSTLRYRASLSKHRAWSGHQNNHVLGLGEQGV